MDAAFGRVIERTAKDISGLGFVRRRNSLLRIACNVAAIIEFQKSTESSRENIRFTINLAVVCGALLQSGQPSLEKARASLSHLRLRIGMLTTDHADKWWEIDERTDVEALATEVADLVARKGAPYLLQYTDEDELVALWKSGKAPGLTETQRLRYLEKLNARL